MSDPAILRLICLAREFDNIRVREEELAELDELKDRCHLEVCWWRTLRLRRVCVSVVRVCAGPLNSCRASFPNAVHSVCCVPCSLFRVPVQVRRGEWRGQDQRAHAGSGKRRAPCSVFCSLLLTCPPCTRVSVPCLVLHSTGVHFAPAHQELHVVVGHVVHHTVRGPCLSCLVRGVPTVKVLPAMRCVLRAVSCVSLCLTCLSYTYVPVISLCARVEPRSVSDAVGPPWLPGCWSSPNPSTSACGLTSHPCGSSTMSAVTLFASWRTPT